MLLKSQISGASETKNRGEWRCLQHDVAAVARGVRDE